MLKRTLIIYATETGREPFVEWFTALQDKNIRHSIQNRLDRLKLGHFGDYESVGDGVLELRFFSGPGFRVYFAEYSGWIIFLLCGGDKKTQTRDIKKAKIYWKECKERTHDRFRTI